MKIFIITTFLLLATSCSSMIARNGGNVKHYPKTYPGVKIDYYTFTNSKGKTFEFMLQIGPLIDLPFSLILDTLLFPYDFRASDNSEIIKINDAAPVNKSGY